MHRIVTVFVGAGLLAGAGACSTEDSSDAQERAGASPSWLLASEPAGGVSVVEAKATASEGAEIVLRARIGGRAAPITPGSPVFTVMDLGAMHCAENPEDACATPWDYCCLTPEAITASAATVQVVGAEEGDLAGLAPLDEVVVVGTVGARPSPEVLTIIARGVHRVEEKSEGGE